MSLYTPRYRLPNQFKTSNENGFQRYYITPTYRNPLFFRDTKKQFCPQQKFVDHRPFPYRSFVKSGSNFNYFNTPIDRENYIPCYKFINQKQCFPLVSRQDLLKYLKKNGKILKHLRPCNSCAKINKGNYGRNYSTIHQKSFPFINGNFIGDNTPRIIPRYKTPCNSRNVNKNNIRYKLASDEDYNNNQIFANSNINVNSMFDKYSILDKKEKEEKEERKNEEIDKFDELEDLVKNNEKVRIKYLSRNNMNNKTFYKPMEKRSFHKTQIFNHYKPYLVDEFKEFAEYK